jgi:hypothetical protein
LPKHDDIGLQVLTQRLLNEVEHLGLPETGCWDPQTAKAVRWYQRTRGISVTGYPDLATVRCLTTERELGRSTNTTTQHTPPSRARPTALATNKSSQVASDPASWITPSKVLGATKVTRIAPLQEEAPDLIKLSSVLRKQLHIPEPSGNGPDGWRVRSGGSVRRIGLLRRLDGQWVPTVERMRQRLDPASTEGAELRECAQRQFDALSQVDARLDASLVLAVAMRESGAGVVSLRASRVNTYHFGGLDFIGDALSRGRLRLPSGYGSRWVPERDDPAHVNEHGRRRRAAFIPRNELLVAYGVVLQRRRQIFEGHVRDIFGDEAEAMLASLSQTARRAWIQISFGGPYGSTFRPGRTYGPNFGVRTALGMMRYEIAEGRAASLDDVLNNEALRRYTRVRRGVVTAAEATLFDHSRIVQGGAFHERPGPTDRA